MGVNSSKSSTLVSSKKRVLAFIGASAFAVGAFVLREINPAGNNYFPQCPFHALTGLNCPGCGATRGFHALLNGDVFGSLHLNVLLVIFVPLMIYAFLTFVSVALRGKFLPFPRISPSWAWVFAATLILFSIARNLPFYPFNLLAV